MDARPQRAPHGRRQAPPPIIPGNTSLEFNEMCNANEKNENQFIDRYVEERVPIDFWWMDAGWYPCGGLAEDRHLGAGP